MWYSDMVESPFEASATGRAMAKGRSLPRFQEMFPDEASCAAFLLTRRWSGGGGAMGRKSWIMELDCGRQTSATAGTVMHRSKLPLTTWFWAALLMATHFNGMSARQLADQLGVTYKTAWLLTQKLRRSMVDPDREPLGGVVEVGQTEIPFRDGDGFFAPGKGGKISSSGRRGDRSRHQSAQAATQARQISRYAFRPIRLATIADNSAASIEAFVRANVKRHRRSSAVTSGRAIARASSPSPGRGLTRTPRKRQPHVQARASGSPDRQ